MTLFETVFSGNDAVYGLTEGAINAAIEQHGADKAISFPIDTTNRDKFRPLYHHTPLYGWMNDANGLVYKDGDTRP